MTLDELRDALHAADPATVLVPGHLLARVIREVTDLPAQVINVPHRKSFILDRAVLLRHVELDDLDLGPDRLLPSRVVLLARPSSDRRNSLVRESTLLTYWRRLFHANVHLQLERLFVEGRLGPDEVAARVAGIGLTEFAEARGVLEQEGYLFPRATDRDVYVEFAAVYLELRYFLPDLLPVYFPGIPEHHRVESVLARDLDAEALFQRTRLAGASGPAPRPDDSADEPTEYCLQLIRDGKRASRIGNNVRAAILRTRAARIAPAAVTEGLRQEVEADLDQLTARLRDALKLSEDERAAWRQSLAVLLDKTGEDQRSVEARLLSDLQSACVDSEREVYALDPVEWALSGGKRPIKRPLSGQRVVRITKHLRSAAQRLSSTRLSEADRQHFGRLLHEALRQNEERLRARFRPVLAETLNDVGLVAANLPEQAARAKMIEELLDRISELGFFNFSELRDAISRNNLKLPDLADPAELVRGDPLLRLDRLLASSPLDGVYRPSEIYLRLLQRVTAPNFGTPPGRLLTRYVSLPFGLALIVLEGVELIHHYVQRLIPGDYEPPPLFGPISVLTARLKAGPPFLPNPGAGDEFGQWLQLLLAPSLWLVLGLLTLGLLYLPAFRRAFYHVGEGLYHAGRGLLVELPLRLLPWPRLRRFLKSWPSQLVYRLVLRPLPLSLLLWWIFKPFEGWWQYALVFLAVVVLMNSRPVRGMEEAGSRVVVLSLAWLRAGLVDGLLRLIVQVFKAITDGVEYVLYTVDEWLRFRAGDSRLSMIVRAVLGVLWFPVSYLARLYIVVLIEPGFNPLKAPISLLAAKFVYPIILALQIETHLKPLPFVPWALAAGTLWLLPDAFGFLIWEMKENWKLYRANRPTELEPVALGPSGETMLRLLKPGFHSGTLPRLFAHLRKAERYAHETGAWREARAVRERLTAIEEAVRRFVTRDVLMLLHLSPEWHKKPLSVGEVALACNQVRIDLCHTDYLLMPLRLVIAEEDARLVARVEASGWLDRLTPAAARTLDQAIAGLYKLAGVDLVRGPAKSPAPGSAYPAEERCAASLNGTADGGAPVLAFFTVPLTWARWVEWWQRDRKGEPPPPIPVLPLAPPE